MHSTFDKDVHPNINAKDDTVDLGSRKRGDEYAQAEAVSVLSFAVVGLHCRTLDPAEYE